MKNRFIYLLSVPFLMSNNSYTLQKDDSISLVMKQNNLISDYSELDKIEKILNLNNLDWDSAKRLPVGYAFVVSEESKPETNVKANDPISKNSFSVEVGVFNENIGQRTNQKRDVYSDLSQYLSLGLKRSISNKVDVGLDIRLNNHVYSESTSQSIENDYSAMLVNPSANLDYSFNQTHSVTGTAEFKSFIVFDVDSSSATDFSSVSDSILSAGYNFAFNILGDYKNVLSLSAGKSLGEYDYTTMSLKLSSTVKSYSLYALYSNNEFEYDSEAFDDKQLSVGLGVKF